MLAVYHAKNPRFGFGPKVDFPAEYEKVADVETNDLEEAFFLTNTVDRCWWENNKVKALKINTRSTSVGDVIVDLETGKKSCVAFCGFESI